MHRRLCHLARAPHLRVLAWLAWAMLALTPAFAAPAGMGGAHGGGQAVPAMQMADHDTHDMSAMTADCCAAPTAHGHAAMSDCHCPVTCASVLPAVAMAELAAVPVAAMPVPRRGAMAPHLNRSPPLRPPLLQTS